MELPILTDFDGSLRMSCPKNNNIKGMLHRCVDCTYLGGSIRDNNRRSYPYLITHADYIICNYVSRKPKFDEEDIYV